VRSPALHMFAVATARFATRLLPWPMREWGIAMQYEVEAIRRSDHAAFFAMACLGFALRQAVVSNLVRMTAHGDDVTSKEALGMTIRSYLIESPRGFAATCSVIATGLGLAYMSAAGAPIRYIVVNFAAMIFGFLIAGVALQGLRSGPRSFGLVGLVFGAVLLLTSVLGTSAAGATRWVSIGGFSFQTSLIVLPIMAVCFARVRDGLATAGIVLAALALALQPDRAMSGALTAGMAALACLKPERNVFVALGAAICGFAVTLLLPDALPAMPYVDQILYSSFDVHPLVGLAVIGGAALMITPAIVGYVAGKGQSERFAVFGAFWFAVIVAAALGNYPTPVVGFGSSAIIGYVLSIIGLPETPRAGEFAQHDAMLPSGDLDQDHNLPLELCHS
jgi:hypothetical protein